jgi:hypothetical protein
MPTEKTSSKTKAKKKKKPPKQRDIDKISARVRRKIKRASDQPQNQNILVYGKPGVKKTRFSATAPDVLIIDVDEEGTDSVRRDSNPQTIRIYSWIELDDIYWYLQEGDHEFKSVAIDGVTGLQTLCMNFVLGEEVARDASRDPDMASRQAWGKIGKLMKTQITNFRNLPMNVIFTATERAREAEEGGDEEEIVRVYGPNVSPSVASHLEQSVGTIGRMVKREVIIKSKKKKTTRREVRSRLLLGDSERYISKDRNGVFGEYIDAPDFTEMLALIYGTKEA